MYGFCCLNKVFSLNMFEFMFDPLQGLARYLGLNTIESLGNMFEVRFPNTYILSNIIYYILPLTVIIVLAIKAVSLSKVRVPLT